MAASDLVTEQLLDAALAAVATRYNTMKSNAGTLASLTTADKSNLVAAINELVTAIAGLSGGSEISDGTTDGTHTWSSTKINSEIVAAKSAVVAQLLGGASAAWDTLQELKGLLDASDTADDNALAALTTAVGSRLSFDAAQALDSTQKAQALSNLGLARSTSDFAATFNAATA